MNFSIIRCLYAAVLICLAGTVPAIAQVEPSGGLQAVTLTSGAPVQITWEDDLQAPRVDLALWNGDEGRETLIATNIEATPGLYQWQIPSSISPGERYRFVVRDHQQPRRAIRSSSWVTIDRAQPLVSTVQESRVVSAMQLSPMPAYDDLTITWLRDDVLHVDILDVQQREVQRCEVRLGDTTKHIDVRTLPNGTYTIRLHHYGGDTSVERLTIMR